MTTRIDRYEVEVSRGEAGRVTDSRRENTETLQTEVSIVSNGG